MQGRTRSPYHTHVRDAHRKMHTHARYATTHIRTFTHIKHTHVRTYVHTKIQKIEWHTHTHMHRRVRARTHTYATSTVESPSCLNSTHTTTLSRLVHPSVRWGGMWSTQDEDTHTHTCTHACTHTHTHPSHCVSVPHICCTQLPRYSTSSYYQNSAVELRLIQSSGRTIGDTCTNHDV